MALKRSASQAIAPRGATGMNVRDIGLGVTGYQYGYHKKPLPTSFLIAMAMCFFMMGFSLGLLFN